MSPLVCMLIFVISKSINGIICWYGLRFIPKMYHPNETKPQIRGIYLDERYAGISYQVAQWIFVSTLLTALYFPIFHVESETERWISEKCDNIFEINVCDKCTLIIHGHTNKSARRATIETIEATINRLNVNCIFDRICYCFCVWIPALSWPLMSMT